MGKLFPKTTKDARHHVVTLSAAFDTAAAFALSFGVKKFQFMQEWVKLVGVIVGVGGREPNPHLCEAIRNWPPITCFKDLQGFLGTTNYARPHAGPTEDSHNRTRRPNIRGEYRTGYIRLTREVFGRPLAARALASCVYRPIVPCRARDCASRVVLRFLRSCRSRSQSHRTSTQVVPPARRGRRRRHASTMHIQSSHE